MSNNSNKKPMAAIGSYDTVLPFQAVGVKPFILKSGDELPQIITNLVHNNYGVIFVEEQFYLPNTDLINNLNQEHDASIMPMPGIGGSIGIGLSAVKSSVERAVGMDIFAIK